jgi:manganese transport protein
VRWLAWAAAGLILALNLRLAKLAIGEWLAGAGNWLWWLVGPVLAGLAALLLYVALEPWFWRRARTAEELAGTTRLLPAAPYRRILVPLDHSWLDQHALAHAAALARPAGARLFLLHVEEGVASQLFGDLASTAEITAGERYFQGILDALAADGIEADLHIVHAGRPKAEIVRYAREIKPDLVVMGAHGHTGWRDLLFGATIDDVRHGIPVPILVVRVPSQS